MALAGGGIGGEVVHLLIEVLDTRADHAAQFVGKDNLVLQVQRTAFDVLVEVSAGACAIGFRLAVHRVVDVDGVRAAGDGRDPFVLAVVFVFGADQHFMLDAQALETSAQFQLGDAVMPVVVAFPVTTIDGAPIRIQRARLAGKA